MEQISFLVEHIKNPCHDLQGNSLRDFYLREAVKTLSTLKETSAKELLADVIKEYKRGNK